ncbi:MAG: hypothetical protein IPJ79_12800 [Bacteroidetes bacterium]|nr:hypothetical protein [Bacteroidota bacterium]HNR20829.1 hypothetical protein [Bacteroidia bacterium]HNU34460.1 hypothetical protein [Bacteroidia bacterium]
MHTRHQLIEMLADHKEWQGKINFYKMEIKALTNELDDFVKGKSSEIDFVQVEHFQNQFIIQAETLDVMRHDFKQHENRIESSSKSPLENLAELHLEEKEKLTQFEKGFKELRESFHAFTQKEIFN